MVYYSIFNVSHFLNTLPCWSSIGTSVAVSSTLIALVLIGRAAFVFPIANIKNCIKTRESTKIEFRSQVIIPQALTFSVDLTDFLLNCSKCQFIIWWAGLMRGAVTIALSYNQFTKSKTTSAQDSALIITSTIIVVLFSTVVFGSITKPLIEAVQLRHSKPAISDSTDNQEDVRFLFLQNSGSINQSNNQTSERRSNLSLLISHPATTVHYFWRKFDDNFMRPVFGGRGFTPIVPGSGEEEEIA